MEQTTEQPKPIHQTLLDDFYTRKAQLLKEQESVKLELKALDKQIKIQEELVEATQPKEAINVE